MHYPILKPFTFLSLVFFIGCNTPTPKVEKTTIIQTAATSKDETQTANLKALDQLTLKLYESVQVNKNQPFKPQAVRELFIKNGLLINQGRYIDNNRSLIN